MEKSMPVLSKGNTVPTSAPATLPAIQYRWLNSETRKKYRFWSTPSGTPPLHTSE